MSTKALRELIEWAARGDSPHACEARSELEAIERAAKFITNVDTSEPLTAELATRAVEASDVFERIAKGAK